MAFPTLQSKMHFKNFANYATHMNGYCHVRKFECIKEQLVGNMEKDLQSCF